MTKDDFEEIVRTVIEAHPDWVDAVIRGVTAGQSAALVRARHDADEARTAMTLALILANKRGRLSDHMTGLIADQITKMIGNPSCVAETEFIDEHRRP